MVSLLKNILDGKQDLTSAFNRFRRVKSAGFAGSLPVLSYISWGSSYVRELAIRVGLVADEHHDARTRR